MRIISLIITMLMLVFMCGCSEKPVDVEGDLSSATEVSSVVPIVSDVSHVETTQGSSAASSSESESISRRSLNPEDFSENDRQGILDFINKTLANYATGLFPSPPVEGTENYFSEPVPTGAVLPESVLWEDLLPHYDIEQRFPLEMVLPLNDNYEMVFLFEIEYYVSNNILGGPVFFRQYGERV